jgi:hypothetical protein
MAVEKGVTLPLGEVDEIPPFAEEDIEIELEDDGSAVVDFMPEEQTPETGFQDNLAEYLDEISLGKLSSDLIGLYEEDKESRSEWYNAFAKGLDLLGIKQEERTQPFEGASGVNHPLLSEAKWIRYFFTYRYQEVLSRKYILTQC